MSNIKCPSCTNKMQVLNEADLNYEKCISCGGIFLDKDELNILATGMSGNIEYCTIDKEQHKDKFPVREWV